MGKSHGAALSRETPQGWKYVSVPSRTGVSSPTSSVTGGSRGKREESRACICHISLCPRGPRSLRTRHSRATVLH